MLRNSGSRRNKTRGCKSSPNHSVNYLWTV